MNPQPISDVEAAFPADVEKLMPNYKDIPDEFKRSSNKWNAWQSKWFFTGLKAFPDAKDGVDSGAAVRHLKAIQGSWQPKHEHKQAAVAYLASLWFTEPSE